MPCAAATAPDARRQFDNIVVPGLIVQSHLHFDALLARAEPLPALPTIVICPESPDAVLGAVDNGFGLLDAVLDRGRAGLGADMLGNAAAAFDMTLYYLKTRKQFGQVICGFQALGHRAAALFSGMELARSCVEAALQALDDDAPDAAQLCSLSKARMGEQLFQMSNQLIQIHGGIGMTDEFDAGLYLKRARVLEAAFGNRAFHRDRYARLLGY